MDQLELKKMINRQLKKSGMTVGGLARELKMTHSGVRQMLDREQLKVQRLAELSEAMNYNFFRELGESLPYAEPDYTDTSEKDRLKERVKELELELKVLKEAISLMKG